MFYFGGFFFFFGHSVRHVGSSSTKNRTVPPAVEPVDHQGNFNFPYSVKLVEKILKNWCI